MLAAFFPFIPLGKNLPSFLLRSTLALQQIREKRREEIEVEVVVVVVLQLPNERGGRESERERLTAAVAGAAVPAGHLGRGERERELSNGHNNT